MEILCTCITSDPACIVVSLLPFVHLYHSGLQVCRLPIRVRYAIAVPNLSEFITLSDSPPGHGGFLPLCRARCQDAPIIDQVLVPYSSLCSILYSKIQTILSIEGKSLRLLLEDHASTFPIVKNRQSILHSDVQQTKLEDCQVHLEIISSVPICTYSFQGINLFIDIEGNLCIKDCRLEYPKHFLDRIVGKD